MARVHIKNKEYDESLKMRKLSLICLLEDKDNVFYAINEIEAGKKFKVFKDPKKR